MAMMLMVKSVKNAGTTDYDPEIGRSDVLHKEVIGERKQVLLVCKSVLSTERWTWEYIENELNTMPTSGWDSAGKEIDLGYLKVSSQGSL